MWSIKVQEWLVTLVGKRIVGMNPFFKTVFKYSFVVMIQIKFNEVNIGITCNYIMFYSFVIFNFTFLDRVFSSCSVNCLTSHPG